MQTQRPNFERSHLTCFSLVVRVLICSLYDSSLWLAYCTHFKINKCVTRLILNCARGKKNALKLALSGFFPRFIRGSIRIYGYFFSFFNFLRFFLIYFVIIFENFLTIFGKFINALIRTLFFYDLFRDFRGIFIRE